ncbi:MAG: hypothetical protein P1P65_03010 [Treponema sp.]
MNESAVFLQKLKASDVTISSETKKKLFTRLFLIENAYRKQFEKFKNVITAAGETYKSSSFKCTEDSLEYSAERIIKAKKYNGKISFVLRSQDSSSATLSLTGKNEFIISAKNNENVKEKIQPVFKTYELKIDRSNYTAEMNKVFENDAIVPEIEQLDLKSDEYAKECEAILDVMSENGASNSKIRVLLGKLGNRHSDN